MKYNFTLALTPCSNKVFIHLPPNVYFRQATVLRRSATPTFNPPALTHPGRVLIECSSSKAQVNAQPPKLT